MGEAEERPWGRYEVLEESTGYKVKRLEVKPGERLSLQRHSRRGEHWVVVYGIADVVCGDRELRLKTGELSLHHLLRHRAPRSMGLHSIL